MNTELPGQLPLFTLDGLDPEEKQRYSDETCAGLPDCFVCQDAMVRLAQLDRRKRRNRKETGNG